jgi:hypothetical protein
MGDLDNTSHQLRLVYLSAIIVLYFLGSGHFTENKVSFTFINVDLDRPWIIFVFVWTLFAWYCWRFWVSLDNKLWQHLQDDFTIYANKRLHKELERQARATNAEFTRFTVFGPESHKWVAESYTWKRRGHYLTEATGQTQNAITLEIPLYSLATLKFIVWLARSRQFDQIVFPFLCAATAVIVALTCTILP